MSFAIPVQIRGSHVLMALGGFFGAMMIANGIFIYLAITTFDGTEKNAYEKGLNYNARIAAARTQDALGWSHRVSLGKDGTVTLTLTGRDDAPLRRLTVEGEISRPVAQRFSQALIFAEAEDGTYRAKTSGLQTGSWMIMVNARKSPDGERDAVYHLKERLWLAPRQ
jgi:nitrogen fixation protein FixH